MYFIALNIVVVVSAIIGVFTNTHNYRVNLSIYLRNNGYEFFAAKDVLYFMHVFATLVLIFTLYLIYKKLFSKNRQEFNLKYHLSLILIVLFLPILFLYSSTKLAGREFDPTDDYKTDFIDAYFIPSLIKESSCNLRNYKLDDVSYYYYPREEDTIIDNDQPVIIWFKDDFINTNRTYLIHNGVKYIWGNDFFGESFNTPYFKKSEGIISRTGDLAFISSSLNPKLTLENSGKTEFLSEAGIIKKGNYIDNLYDSPDSMKNSFSDLTLNNKESILNEIKSNGKWEKGEYELHMVYSNGSDCAYTHIFKFKVEE